MPASPHTLTPWRPQSRATPEGATAGVSRCGELSAEPTSEKGDTQRRRDIPGGAVCPLESVTSEKGRRSKGLMRSPLWTPATLTSEGRPRKHRDIRHPCPRSSQTSPQRRATPTDVATERRPRQWVHARASLREGRRPKASRPAGADSPTRTNPDLRKGRYAGRRRNDEDDCMWI